MRRLTVVASLLLAVILVTTAVIGLTTAGVLGTAGSLEEQWRSDTQRGNVVNHHPVAVGPSEEVIIAPVTGLPNAEPITALSCSLYRLAPSNGSIIWRASIPPDACFSHAFASPEIADITDDGQLEAVTVTTEHAIMIYDTETGVTEAHINLSTYGYGQPAVGHLTSTRGQDIAVVDINAGVYLVNDTNQLAWETHLEGNAWASPIIDDISADGHADVLVATSDQVSLLNSTGVPLWNQSGYVETITTGQVDDDPAVEVFVPDGRTLSVLDGATGSQDWTIDFNAGVKVGPVADADQDGTPEVYLSLTSQTIVRIDPTTGTERWRTQIVPRDSGPMPPPELADVTGDGEREVIAAATDGTVAVLDARSGQEVAAYERDIPIWTQVTPADLDGDGDDELLVRYGDGIVIALDFHPADAIRFG